MRRLLLSLTFCMLACEPADEPELVQVGDPSSVPVPESGSPAPATPSDGGGRSVGGSRVVGAGARPSAGMGSTLDAAVPSPSETAADAGSSYACERTLDCVIRDVGSCCGYYPRCVSTAAVFSAPSCASGQVGVCGFPSIDSCECRQNRCISLQAGKPL